MVFASTTQTVPVKAASLLGQMGKTDISLWHFVINQIDKADQPATIHVYWTNGITNYEADVPVTQQENKMAHYTVAADDNTTGYWVWDAEAQVPGDWKGEFVLSHFDQVTPPVPEMPAVALLGLGVAGIGTYVYLQRRKAAATS